MTHVGSLPLISSVLGTFLLVGVGGSRFDPSKVPPLGPPPSRLANSALELALYHGYDSKRYEAVTEDGYILGMTRISSRSRGFPVLMVNGLALGPELWVLHGPGHDLAFVLSDLGYDVWLGGQRGLVGSDDHMTLNAKQAQYWNFSHDESGKYDLPAMMDLIRLETGREEVLYVGTSLGGTLFMVMCSERPDYCRRVAGNVQLVPAIYIPSWKSLQLITKVALNTLRAFLFVDEEVGKENLLRRPAWYKVMMNNVCSAPVGEDLCFALLNIVIGFTKKNMAPGWLGYTLTYAASGTSVRQVEHLIIQANEGGSRKYDWGPDGNMMMYNSTEPPSYDLGRIISPTLVFYSKMDRLLPPQVMEKGLSLIGNLYSAQEINDTSVGHAEFVFGKNMYRQIFPQIVDFFDKMSNQQTLNNAS